MKHCIIKPHHAGLFSLINNVITCLDLYDFAEVDWTGGTLYSKPGEDLWGALFEPLNRPIEFGAGSDDDTVAIINSYPDQWLTYKNAAKLYQGGEDWRRKCWKLWMKLCPKLEISQHVDEVTLQRFARNETIAVLVRANSHAGEQVSDQSQSLDRYAKEIEQRLIQGNNVYAACGDRESLIWLSERFPVVYHPRTKRSHTRDIDRHLAVPQTIQDAINCLEEVMIMACASTLIHPVSNMATAALYMNPELRSIYLP